MLALAVSKEVKLTLVKLESIKNLYEVDKILNIYNQYYNEIAI